LIIGVLNLVVDAFTAKSAGMMRLTRTVALCALAGCSKSETLETATAKAGLHVAVAVTVPFGAQGLGIAPTIAEQRGHGPSALAPLPGTGAALVLDSVNARVVRIDAKGSIVEIAKVDRDANDLATSADGAFAIKRAMTPKVVVYTAKGERIGELGFGILQNVDHIELGPSRRVTAVSAHQERYQLGSPSVPLSEGEILHSKVEGTASRVDGAALHVVRSEDGEMVIQALRVSEKGESKSHVVNQVGLGKASSGRMLGVTANVACVRVEHVSGDAVVQVSREIVCANTLTGAIVLRRDLGEAPELLLEREAVFRDGTLTYAIADADKGLTITRVNVSEVVR
jgi:hypothetical protein